MNASVNKFRTMPIYQPGGGSGSGGGSGVNNNVSSWAELAALPTTSLTKPYSIIWVESSTGIAHTTQLRAGTDATDTASGIQRPDDYGVSNQYVWYEA
jgi:hypothetical protein